MSDAEGRTREALRCVEGVIQKMMALDDAAGFVVDGGQQFNLAISMDGMKLEVNAVYGRGGRVTQSAKSARQFIDNSAPGNLALLIEDIDRTLRERLEKREALVRGALGRCEE